MAAEDITTILLLLAALAFVLQAFKVVIGTLTPQWWAIGVALYLASLAV
jgi:hypothetical protein